MTSLGITRGFPRLCPTMGLVTVALLTLAPLALRPVRLACLIHAANVHSEPGSNPSRCEVNGLKPESPIPTLLLLVFEDTDNYLVAANQDEREITPLATSIGDSMNLPNQSWSRTSTPASLKGTLLKIIHKGLRLIDQIVKEPSRSILPDAISRNFSPKRKAPACKFLAIAETKPSSKPTRTNHSPSNHPLP